MSDSDGFVPITAIFYAVFHPTEGTKVLHQVPNGSIAPPPEGSIYDSSSLPSPLFDFDSVKNYVIPKHQLCNRLITFKVGNYRVVGFPVNIYSERYARNSYSFNFCFVFPYESDTTPYEGQVKRIGKMFRALEEQSQILSKAEKDHDVYFINKPNSSTDFSSNTVKNNTNTNANISSMEYLRNGNNNFINNTNNNNIINSNINKGNQLSKSKYLKTVTDLDNIGNQVAYGTAKENEVIAPGQLKVEQVKLSSIESLIQQIYQDLNNYSECLIPIDGSNSVDIKLFPILPPPPEVNSTDVPLTTVKLDSMIDALWDPTMVKILPFINGINSVKKISLLADANYELTKQCIKYLLHYKSIIMIDIFQFSNCYAPTSNLVNFLRDPNMGPECQAYIVSEGQFGDAPLRLQRTSTSYHDDGNNSNNNNNKPVFSSSASSLRGKQIPEKENQFKYHSISLSPVNSTMKKIGKRSQKITIPSIASLFYLYRSLSQNYTVKRWYSEHHKELQYIDVRRFISFGIVRGIIYRVRTYPVSYKIATELEIGHSAFSGGVRPNERSYSNSQPNLTTKRRTESMTRGSGSITGLTNFRSGKSLKQKDSITEENNDSAIADDDEDDEDADADNYDNNDKDATGVNRIDGDYVVDNGAGNQNEAHFDITPGSRTMGPIREGHETTYKSRGDQEQSETHEGIDYEEEKTRRGKQRSVDEVCGYIRRVKDFDFICTAMEKDKVHIEQLLDSGHASKWHIINS